MYQFPNEAFEKNYCALDKISLHFQMVVDQRLSGLHKPFSWTLVGPSIDKMIGLQSQMRV